MKKAVVFAILAAALYALNSPFSKLLLRDVPPTMMAGFLYLGAGVGMGLLGLIRARGNRREAPLTRRDLPYTLGMVVLDIAAPIFLMVGLTSTTAANASLLNNFEIVATSLIAMPVFRERSARRLWLAIGLITLSSILLSWRTRKPAVLHGARCLCFWLACAGAWKTTAPACSRGDPLEMVVIKGLGSGPGLGDHRLLPGGSAAPPWGIWR